LSGTQEAKDGVSARDTGICSLPPPALAAVAPHEALAGTKETRDGALHLGPCPASASTPLSSPSASASIVWLGKAEQAGQTAHTHAFRVQGLPNRMHLLKDLLRRHETYRVHGPELGTYQVVVDNKGNRENSQKKLRLKPHEVIISFNYAVCIDLSSKNGDTYIWDHRKAVAKAIESASVEHYRRGNDRKAKANAKHFFSVHMTPKQMPVVKVRWVDSADTAATESPVMGPKTAAPGDVMAGDTSHETDDIAVACTGDGSAISGVGTSSSGLASAPPPPVGTLTVRGSQCTTAAAASRSCSREQETLVLLQDPPVKGTFIHISFPYQLRPRASSHDSLCHACKDDGNAGSDGRPGQCWL